MGRKTSRAVYFMTRWRSSAERFPNRRTVDHLRRGHGKCPIQVRSRVAALVARPTRCRWRYGRSNEIRWLSGGSSGFPKDAEAGPSEKLAAELLDAFNNRGTWGAEKGRHAQDGGGEQSLCSLPLVICLQFEKKQIDDRDRSQSRTALLSKLGSIIS